MKFLRAWWLQIVGVVVVLGFLGWLGLEGIPLPGRQVSGSGSSTPTLTAQQEIEQTVKEFKTAFDLSGKTEDPSQAIALTIPDSSAAADASGESDLAKQTDELRIFSNLAWGTLSVGVAGQTAVVDGDYSVTYYAAKPGTVQAITVPSAGTFHWHGVLKNPSGQWRIQQFLDSF